MSGERGAYNVTVVDKYICLYSLYVFDPNKFRLMFVRGRFQGSCYCSNLQLCIRIYIYEYKRSRFDDRVIPKLLLVLFTESVLRKATVDRGLWFSTKQ